MRFSFCLRRLRGRCSSASRTRHILQSKHFACVFSLKTWSVITVKVTCFQSLLVQPILRNASYPNCKCLKGLTSFSSHWSASFFTSKSIHHGDTEARRRAKAKIVLRSCSSFDCAFLRISVPPWSKCFYFFKNGALQIPEQPICPHNDSAKTKRL